MSGRETMGGGGLGSLWDGPPKPVGCFVFTAAGFEGGVEVSEAVASPPILNEATVLVPVSDVSPILGPGYG